jgi:preprotein translocase subunit YajC
MIIALIATMRRERPLMLVRLLLWAQESSQPKGPAPGGDGGLGILLLLPLFMLLFWLIVLRPAQKRQEREQAEKLNNLQKGDEVLTIGGIYGSVVSISDPKDKDEIVVKIDDHTRVKMTRNAIHRNLSHEERLKKAKETPKS